MASSEESKHMTEGTSIEHAMNFVFEEVDKMKDGVDFDRLAQLFSTVKTEEDMKKQNTNAESAEHSVSSHQDLRHKKHIPVPKNDKSGNNSDLTAAITVLSHKIMKAPVCLIENKVTNKGLKFLANPEALEILSNIKQPVVVISIVGMYRTGKSYLMNKLAGAPKGFCIGSTVQSQTKGIWMWCVPHPTIKDHTLVLLDTEGLGDVEKGDGKNDTWLFALGLLLSSTLVYNSKGTIDQDALDKLKFVLDVSDMIKIKSKDNENEEDEFSTYFPNFVWTVRDFTLQLQIDGEEVSEDEYMENALKLKQAAANKKLSRKDKEFNDLREGFRKFFPKRKCFVFDMPTSNKHLLHQLDSVPDTEISSDFIAQTRRFCEYVFQNAAVKRLKVTIPVTGDRLGELAKIYTEAVNSSKIACMEEAVVSLAERENKAAIQEAVQHYEDKMRTVELPTKTLDDFMAQSRKYEDEARQMFMKRSFNDEDKKFLKTFLENIALKKKEFTSNNEMKSREICDSLLKELSVNLEKALAEKAYSVPGGYVKYKQDIKEIEDTYNMKSENYLTATEVLQEYIKSKQSTEIMILMEDNTLSMKEKEKQEEETKKKMEEMAENMKKVREDEQRKMLEEERASTRETIRLLMVKMDEDRKLFSEKMDQVIKEKNAEMEKFQREGMEKKVKDLEKEVEELKKKKCIIS